MRYVVQSHFLLEFREVIEVDDKGNDEDLAFGLEDLLEFA